MYSEYCIGVREFAIDVLTFWLAFIGSLRNPACTRQFSSYRATFEIPANEWTTIRLPWSEFVGHGPGCEDTALDPSTLRRIGLVAIGKEMDVFLGLNRLGFYSVF